jgi:hypothetical protein
VASGQCRGADTDVTLCVQTEECDVRSRDVCKLNARSGYKLRANRHLVESSYKYLTLGNFHLSLTK